MAILHIENLAVTYSGPKVLAVKIIHGNLRKLTMSLINFVYRSHKQLQLGKGQV